MNGKLIADQRPLEDDEKISRVDFYAEHLGRDACYLPKELKYIAADGYYTKSKFVKAVDELDLHLIGKLRHDANLRYLYNGPQKKFGRRRQYDGKVTFDDLSRFDYVGEVEPDIHLYTLVVNNVNLNCHIRLVYVLNLRNQNKPR